MYKDYSVPSRFPSSTRKQKLKTLSQFEESQLTLTRNQELEHQLKMASKQNDKLASLNQYLQATLNKRNEIIFEERQFYKTRNVFNATKSNTTSKRQSQIFQLRKSSMPYSSQPSRLQYVGEENFRISQVLDINTPDEEAISFFENDPNIRFVRQLDEDTFVQIAEEQNIKKLLQIHDHMLKLLNFLKEMFDAILRFKKLIKASYQMNQQVQLNDAIHCIVDQTQQLMSCERATCYIVDETKGEIWSRVAQGINSIIRMPIDKGVAGFVACRKEAVNIPNAYADDRFNRESDIENHFKTQTILAAPIIGDNNQCLGVLQCLNKQSGVFTNEDLAYLKYICGFSKTVLNHQLNQNQVEYAQNKLRYIIHYFLEVEQLTSVWDIIIKTERVLKKVMNSEESRVVIKQQDQIHFYKSGEEAVSQDFLGIMKKSIENQNYESTLNNAANPLFDPTMDIDTQMPVITIPIQNIAAFQVINIKGVNKKQSQFSHSAYISGLEMEMLEYIKKILMIKLK